MDICIGYTLLLRIILIVNTRTRMLTIYKKNINFVEHFSLEYVCLNYNLICVLHISKNVNKQNNQKINW